MHTETCKIQLGTISVDFHFDSIFHCVVLRLHDVSFCLHIFSFVTYTVSMFLAFFFTPIFIAMDEMKNRACSIKLRGSIWFFSSPSLLSLQIACVRTKKDLLQRRCNSLLAVSIGKKCVCLEKRCSEKHAHSDLGLVHRFVMAFLSDCHWLDPA